MNGKRTVFSRIGETLKNIGVSLGMKGLLSDQDKTNRIKAARREDPEGYFRTIWENSSGWNHGTLNIVSCDKSYENALLEIRDRQVEEAQKNTPPGVEFKRPPFDLQELTKIYELEREAQLTLAPKNLEKGK